MIYDLIIVGGGAAGVFAAINAKITNPKAKILIIEKSEKLLTKVALSGGGRCNLANAIFDPKSLVKNYPRGEKELVGLFCRFQSQDTIDWFEKRGVELKIEKDGRIFPKSNASQTIVKCLLDQLKQLHVEVLLQKNIEKIEKMEKTEKNQEQFILSITTTTKSSSSSSLPSLSSQSSITGGFSNENKAELKDAKEQKISAKRLLLATGSSFAGYEWAKQFGHRIEKPIPSLFALNLPNCPLKKLSGISLESVEICLENTPFCQKGALLFTHFGLSGPAIIKLSSFGAKYLDEKNYYASLAINFLPDYAEDKIFELLKQIKEQEPKKKLFSENIFRFPKSFWQFFLELLGENFQKPLKDISLKDLKFLAQKLHKTAYLIEGKTQNKEEFVTCGGVSLKEIDFKTMQSRCCKGLFFAGEVLDIDGLTGGFNLQNAWTTGFIAGISAVSIL
jgi:hypothetical protein